MRMYKYPVRIKQICNLIVTLILDSRSKRHFLDSLNKNSMSVSFTTIIHK